MSSVFAILKIGDALKIGRIHRGHNLTHDAIVKGPFSNFESAQTSLVSVQAKEAHHAS